MVGAKNAKNDSQTPGELMLANTDELKLPWERLPLNLLVGEQKLQIQNQAKTENYTTGKIIWSSESSDGSQFIVLGGKVRLISGDRTMVLQAGDWFGDVLELSGEWKARAASKEVVVARWHSGTWAGFAVPEIEQFWAKTKQFYQPPSAKESHLTTSYPYLAHPNTAAASLSMLAQQLENPASIDWVKRSPRR